MENKKIYALAAALLLGVLCVLSTKIYYTGAVTTIETSSSSTHLFPHHVDEWQHLALSEYALEEQSLPTVNPYIESRPEKYNFEIGFTLLNAVLIGILPFDPVRVFSVLPAIFMALTMGALFYCMRARLGFRASLLSAILLIFVPSNINLTGFWFYTPLTASLPLIFVIFGFYLRSNVSIKLLLLSGILLSIYPPGFFLIFLLISAFEVIGGNQQRRYIFSALLFLLLLTTFLLADFTVFSSSWQKTFAETYNPFVLLGSLLSFLAALGVFYTYRDLELTWLLWPLITGCLLLIYHVANATVLIPYPRLLYYFMVGIIPLAGIGLHQIIKDTSWLHPISTVITVTLILLLSYHGVSDQRFRLQDFISQQDMSLLKTLQSKQDTNKVLSNPHLASAIYPVTGDYVPSLPDSLLKYGDTSIYRSFLQGNCQQKRALIEDNNIDYIITPQRINCQGLVIETSTDKYLYRVNQ